MLNSQRFFTMTQSDFINLSKRFSLVSHHANAQQYPTEKESEVDINFIENMKFLMRKLKLNGKTLLACAWTALEDSRRFKIDHWVSAWDGVKGLNSEAIHFYGPQC